MSRVSRAGVLAAYRDGVMVICELAAQFSEANWLAATPCAEWRAVDLAGHLRCVADDYHEYLDDAPASRLARLMAANAPADSLARKLARQNAAELAALPDAPGPEHIMAFAESARSYGRRLPQSWDLTHHSYRGIEVTVGAMAGAACAEWHLHAWDLARSLGKDYRPANPGLVLAAWRGGTPQLWPELAEWDGLDPWHYLLTASSRDPEWPRVLEWCALKLDVIIQQRRVTSGRRRVLRTGGALPVRVVRRHPGPVCGRLAGADPVAFGYRSAGRPGTSLPSAGLQRAAWADWATAAGLAVLSLVTLACWIAAWRRRLRADGILIRASRRRARRESRAQRRRQRGHETAVRTPDPAQVLSELRTLLTPLLAEPADGRAEPTDGQAEPDQARKPDEDHQLGVPAVPHPRAGGLAAMESMLAGAELLLVGCGEEEAW